VRIQSLVEGWWSFSDHSDIDSMVRMAGSSTSSSGIM
jgi:hypothetical protein